MNTPSTVRGPADSALVTELDVLEAQGYDVDFEVTAPSVVRCTWCQRHVHPARFSVSRVVRLEGASDPADELAVVPTRCPVCSVKGRIVVGYGPNADDADASVLAAIAGRLSR